MPNPVPTPNRGFMTWTPRQGPSSTPKPSVSSPVPMDIDATNKNRELPDVCQRCGRPGHWMKDCPRRFDIRCMTSDERQEWIQQAMMEMDMAEVTEKKEETGEEDFPESSG